VEIVVRAVVVYGLVWGLLRAMGRRELAEVSAFELVILVVIGDLVQQGVTQEDMSVTGAMLAVSTMAMLAVAGSAVSARWPASRSALEGRPLVVVHDGVLVTSVLRHERITAEEVREAARSKGWGDLGEIAWGILEADGRFSFVGHGPPVPG